LVNVDYLYFASYTILQFIVLATAWNILGGYCGYVNFGSAAFFAMGAYASVFMHKFYQVPIPVLIVIGAAVSGLAGLGMGYLTLRLRGSFFAIATLAFGRDSRITEPVSSVDLVELESVTNRFFVEVATKHRQLLYAA